MQRDKRFVEAGLRKKGFKPEEGDHHFFFYQTLSGLITDIRTKTSHSKKVKALDDTLLALMARQCRIGKPDFIRLVDCPLDQAGYERLLQASDPEALKP